MAAKREGLRDWHRLFGLLLTDFFAGSPFTVEVERDLSLQQQLLDVVVRRGRGRFIGRLPDGLEDLAEHNLITFKSHHEALDGWAMRELLGHYVAYRKLVSPSPSALLPEAHFRLYAVTARFPHNLSAQLPWQQQQPGVYDCRWGLDVVRVVVARELSRATHNAPLHLFSAAPELVAFASGAYRQRSSETSMLLTQLFEGLHGEGWTMTFTMEDFKRQFFKDHFARLTLEEQRAILQSLPRAKRREILQALPLEEQRDVLESLPLDEQREILQSLPPDEQAKVVEALPLETRLAGLSKEQLEQYLEQLPPTRPSGSRKPRRKS